MDRDNNLIVQFCVPALRTKLILAEPWTFTLFSEYRNQSLIEAVGEKVDRFDWKTTGDTLRDVTLPEGTQLSVDRIYVRNGKSEYDSITFCITKCPDERFSGKGKGRGKKMRFWAKLYDVNKIKCFPIGTDPNTVRLFGAFVNPGVRLLEV